MRYKILEHAADVKIRAFGANREEVFINSAVGMMEYIYPHTKNFGVGVCQKEIIMAEGRDLESLLVNWLSEILYLSDVNGRVYFDFKILEFGEKAIKAEAQSCLAAAEDDIKAVTYSELKIEKRGGGWAAEVVYDI
ncbi:archease [Candidatus Falkowbacteria bacterium]|nr:archease [Candidatus Falkowbacteria bacterium]